MTFNYAIPKARYKATGFRAPDGHLVETLTKVRRATRNVKYGQRNRRIVIEKTEGGVEYMYHATKGWRSRKS